MRTSEYTEISKGVKLLCVGSDKFKTNYINVDFFLPITEHLAAQTVLASFMGHTSKKYDTFKKFSAKVESLYGADFETSSATVGERLRIRFALEIPDDRFSLDGKAVSNEAAEFISEILKNPNCENGCFEKKNTEREIRFALENIEAEKNDKRAYAVSRLRQLMCAGEPYGIDREKLEEDIKNLDGEKLYKGYRNMLETAQIFVTACGSIKEDMLRETIFEFVSGVENRNPAETETVFIEKAGEVRYFTENMEVSQAKLVIGLRTGMTHANDDYSAFRVMTDIFGGGPYSRLFANVREKMSLCYYCSARLLREKGIIFIQCGVEKENYEEALKEILNQLDIVKNGGFTDEDFDSSISALTDAYRGVGDTPSAICTFYGSQAFDNSVASGAEIAARIEKVTREDVVRCANRVSVDSVYLLAGEDCGDE